MSKGTGLIVPADTEDGDPVTSMDAEIDFTGSEAIKTDIDTKMQQILDDIIYWGKNYSIWDIVYGRYVFEIIEELDSKYDALEKTKENIEDLETESEEQEY